jgi:hypothetical protein
MTMVVFWGYIYLSIFCAGIMLVLQLQYFALYPIAGIHSVIPSGGLSPDHQRWGSPPGSRLQDR